MSKRKIYIFGDNFSLTNFLIKKWFQMAQESIRIRGQFTMALPGGSSPLEFYARLAAIEDSDIWKQTFLFQADERFVPVDHVDNNYRMIKKILLDYIPISNSQCFPMKTYFDNVELAAKNHQDCLESFFRLVPHDIPIFDFVLLGVGADGHVASLFPNDSATQMTKPSVLAVENEMLEYDRVSLSLPTINRARMTICLMTGSNKALVAENVFEKNKHLPIQQVAPIDGELLILLDKSSASRLSYSDDYIHEDEAIVIER